MTKNNKLCKGRSRYEDITGLYFANIKSNARKGNKVFNIKIEDIWEVFKYQKRSCKLSGVPLKFKSNKYDSPATASLDRIDSSKGYTI